MEFYSPARRITSVAGGGVFRLRVSARLLWRVEGRFGSLLRVERAVICAAVTSSLSRALIALGGFVWHGLNRRLNRGPIRLPFCLKMYKIARLQISSCQPRLEPERPAVDFPPET